MIVMLMGEQHTVNLSKWHLKKLHTYVGTTVDEYSRRL